MATLKKKRKLKKVTKDKKETSPYAQIDWENVIKLFQETQPTTEAKSKFPSVKQILHILAAAGTIGLVFAFPGAAIAFGKLMLNDEEYSPWRMKKTLGQLQRQKFVSIHENEDGSTTVKITRKGLTRALTYKLDSMQIKKPKKWDRRWRVVIFDIPEKHRRLRNVFRDRLQQLDLYQLQESVYVSPYPCFNEIEFLRELYGIAFKVQYLLVERIEDDNHLKSYFFLD